MVVYGYSFIREEELKHYGLEGMHWGIRRWQNYDATNSFNAAGIERYFGRTPGKGSVAKELGKKPIVKADAKPSKYKVKSDNAKKNISDLKERGTDADAFKAVYGSIADISDTDFKKAYGFEKNQLVQNLIKKNEDVLVKNTKREERKQQGIARIQKVLGCSEEDAIKVQKAAKIIGISLAVTGGMVAAAYLYKNRQLVSNIIKNPNAYFQVLDGNYNVDVTHALKRFKLDSGLFNNKLNGDYIGDIARSKGYGEINASYIINALKNPTLNPNFDFNALIKNVRVNLVENGAGRRLSCWSTADSYWLSAMTGKSFASKSFENLVDFNDFKSLFIKQPKIFNVDGSLASNFVGKFGTIESRATEDTARQMIRNIFKNISSANNLAVDGKTTIGFIDAGYHRATCTHQWNFELKDVGNGIKQLFISDGYEGERFAVAKMVNGTIEHDSFGMARFFEEIRQFNASSFRFYAPSINDIDPEMWAKVVLGSII